MSSLRIGLIGLGYWGKHYCRILNELTELSLVAMCDKDGHRLTYWQSLYPQAKVYTDPKQFFSCPLDGVIIATPVSSHYQLVKIALEAGLPVLVEKPLTANSHQAEELAILAERRRLPLLVGHTYLFSEPIRYLRQCLVQGSLGHLQYINSRRLNLGPVRTDCSVLWDLAVHDMAILLYLLGEEPAYITAHLAGRNPGNPVDYAVIQLDYDRGISAVVQVSWFWPEKVRALTLIGSLAAAHFNDQVPQSPIRLYVWKPLSQSSQVNPEQRPCEYTTIAPTIPISEPLGNVVKHFVQCIRGQTTPISDAWFAIRVIRLLEQAEHSTAFSKGLPHAAQPLNLLQPIGIQ